MGESVFFIAVLSVIKISVGVAKPIQWTRQATLNLELMSYLSSKPIGDILSGKIHASYIRLL